MDWARPSRAVQQLEEELAAYCGVRHAIATSSGSAALLLTMLALELDPGDEVITAANTFVATAASIRVVGAVPVLTDVDPDSYGMSAEHCQAVLSNLTGAVVLVHLFGRLASVEEVRRLAASSGVPVIEEACQALGAARGGRRAGSFGLAAVFSFGREKAIAGIGEGGAVVTDDDGFARQLRLYCNQGREGHDHVLTGLNFRMDPLEAAVVSVELAHADETLARRQQIAERYNAAFTPLGIVHNPRTPDGESHGWYVYAVEVDERERFCRALDSRGIGWSIHYRRPVHGYSAYKELARPGELPVAERLCERLVSLPLRQEMTDEDVHLVIEAVYEASSHP